MKKENDPLVWIEYAESDLAVAKIGRLTKNIKNSSLCFHSQQSAEKSIKAILVFHEIDFPKTHDIKTLLKLLKNNKIEVPTVIDEVQYLTKYATTARYPGDEISIDKKQYKETIDSATLVLKWAKSIINKKYKLL